MSEDLIKSVEELINSTKGGVQRLNYALNILKQEGGPLFLSGQKPESSSHVEMFGKLVGRNKKRKIIQSMNEEEKVIEVIEEFMDEFEANSLPHNVSVKNYLIFVLIILKILRKIKPGHQRSLHAANTLSRLNKMFSKYPVNYKKRTTRDPLGLLFVITELILEAGRSLGFAYEMDEITSYQFVSLVTKYCIDSENPLQKISSDISDMPKFRLPVEIGESHKEVIAKIFEHCLPKLPAKIRIEKTTNLLEKIIQEKNDSLALADYNTLKLFFEKDNEIRHHLSKIAKEEKYQTGHRMFVKGIIDELARLV